ncbi:putative Phosphatidylethanolamine-binding protein PEBP [Vibrio nigripulchritudo MADA3029]|uniref:YbhB/YbcL family Raf kinase inhibitor-like protein n=1 Tax=Vibrio nigripulchritudo TaxID=28173 RepID=UPI0003B20E4A|nr:YbhB/YbcL family Raf kinase inhibitor-like protein [Vibrio nigripulchritudo]CCN50253.1 putative Phosphatidylethanolamine-binding protein PEBP [Vibrio nigripulchritudo MADA3020]CCN53320.1 putative Phosphatidylethanolamine-binding protein PEBP [Vibrio nigripulchritudo MADA3021]CCN60191.1 putative Phosphatidylethanolamine-binding protein PEBP [Vibrio nigripulchritudo MADA3029]
MKAQYLALVLTAVSMNSAAFTLTSSDIQEGSRMKSTFEFKGFGCEGDNLSPALSWKDAPKGTKSFAITVYDPDAPTGSGWWHWVATDIPANVTHLKRGASTQVSFAGKERKSDYGVLGFGGACPPKGHGMHRYQFTVWALPTQTLNVPKHASNAIVGYTLNSTSLGKATLTATYVRE